MNSIIKNAIFNASLKNKADVERFVVFLIKDLGLNYHPDEDFNNYIDLATGKRTFTVHEAKTLNERNAEAFRVMGNDLYSVGFDEIMGKLGVKSENRKRMNSGGATIGSVKQYFETVDLSSLSPEAQNFIRNSIVNDPTAETFPLDNDTFVAIKDFIENKKSPVSKPSTEPENSANAVQKQIEDLKEQIQTTRIALEYLAGEEADNLKDYIATLELAIETLDPTYKKSGGKVVRPKVAQGSVDNSLAIHRKIASKLLADPEFGSCKAVVMCKEAKGNNEWTEIDSTFLVENSLPGKYKTIELRYSPESEFSVKNLVEKYK